MLYRKAMKIGIFVTLDD